MPSFRESSQLRDWACLSYNSCIGKQFFFFTTSATWEAPLVRMAIIKSLQVGNAGEGVEKGELPYTVVGM